MKHKSRIKFSDLDCEAVAEYLRHTMGEPVNRVVVERYIDKQLELHRRDWVAMIRQMNSRMRSEATKC